MFSWMRQRAPHRAQRVGVVYERRGDLENTQNGMVGALETFVQLSSLFFGLPNRTK